MASSSRSPSQSRRTEPSTDAQGRHPKASTGQKSASLSTNLGTSSSRYQSSTAATTSAASSIRRQSLFGTDDRVVLDIGTRMTRIGFSGESRPRDIFWSVEGNEVSSSSYDHALWTTDLCRCKSEKDRRLIEVKLKAKLTHLLRGIFYQWV
jgi:actin-related protein 10